MEGYKEEKIVFKLELSIEEFSSISVAIQKYLSILEEDPSTNNDTINKYKKLKDSFVLVWNQRAR